MKGVFTVLNPIAPLFSSSDSNQLKWEWQHFGAAVLFALIWKSYEVKKVTWGTDAKGGLENKSLVFNIAVG